MFDGFFVWHLESGKNECTRVCGSLHIGDIAHGKTCNARRYLTFQKPSAFQCIFVFLSGRARRGSDIHNLEPRMIFKKPEILLSYYTGRAQNADRNLFIHPVFIRSFSELVEYFHEESRAARKISANTPAAVTSAPAPGPLTTSGVLLYRRVVNAIMLSLPDIL